MKRKQVVIQKTEIHLDPRYPSVRPWDWRLCRRCGSLFPNRCPCCDSDKLSDKSRLIVRAAQA